ncbi:hypothetical protein COT75_04110 [Candidatus Beckwithbacteria bacterium CG10_big_fil_rev_8_21_14_0_10_34_10]|uniref:Uncharacterized protein n=1 Tax=Candidatus Beckwithbacteria bacterium CG10_big_fil_rev_8_21_14_0_10_34_10 TaxID=1974495 RepID=A0A2H0W8R6_9BACT|nr:MAG: hypothetical protein COT75_04110 [Candidatus Beckwithbacteria bacterium CG10_big_fil_rev_8_21_14_0_10_34_10]
MDEKKLYFCILIIDVLLLLFLGAISLRFIMDEHRKSREMDPEVLIQQTIDLEVDRFLSISKKFNK